MKQEAEQLCKSMKSAKAGFTIVELLTVMSVILILMSLLVPALNSLRIHAYYVKQKNQFHGMDVALEFFNTEREGYPDSSEFDRAPQQPMPYCGAMKLAEAMVGQDLLGFNPQSKFYQLGTNDGLAQNGNIPSIPSNPPGNVLYPGRYGANQTIIAASIKERKELYLPLENSNAYTLGDLYQDTVIASSVFGSAAATLPVLCDVYIKVVHRTTGKNVGMPILYYKADTRKYSHDFTDTTIQQMISTHTNPYNIYNFWDNDALVRMGIPTEVSMVAHPMASTGTTYDGTLATPAFFYRETWNENMPNIAGNRPYKADSYILMSAGFDGIYGTKDDVFNFEK